MSLIGGYILTSAVAHFRVLVATRHRLSKEPYHEHQSVLFKMIVRVNNILITPTKHGFRPSSTTKQNDA
jgi:hypothetical protein